jgi:hypothetical protein
MRIRNLIVFIILLTVINIYGANNKEYKKYRKHYKKPLNLPRKFSVITNELDTKADDNFSQELWIVFSDRNNNKIYTLPDTTSQVRNIANFLDAFYVAAQNDDFVLLVQGNLKKGKFEKDVNFMGWIPKRNLILSKHTLKDKNYIYRKALVINSINHIQEVLEKKNINTLSYREGPGLNYPERDTSRVFKIYFVLKTNETPHQKPTMYLLARRSLLYSSIDLEKAKLINQKIILGWIPASSVTPWNHRVAVEQNWDVDAVIQRKKYKTPAMIFLDKENLKSADKLDLKNNIVLLRKDRFYETNIDFYNNNKSKLQQVLEDKRLDGYNMRYPIIDNYGNDIYSVGFIGDVYISKLKKLTSVQEAKGQKIISKLKRDFSKTNIVFVVDATNSMTPYLKTVSQAISDAMQLLSKDKNIKFAGFIYRDKNDPLPEPVKLTNDFAQVSDFFKNQRGFSKQKPFAENMYQGIVNGLEESGMQAGQHNCLVLISDVGDHKYNEKIYQKKVAELLNKYKCNFLAIQVGRKSRTPEEKEANDDFYIQTTKFVYDAINLSAKELGQKPPSLIPPGNIYRSYYEYSAKGPLFQAKILPLEKHKVLKKHQLKNYILTFINSVQKNTEIILNNLDNIAQGKGLQIKNQNNKAHKLTGSNFERNDLEQLTLNMMKMANLDINLIDKIKEKRFQLYVNGLIKNRFKLPNNELSYPLFKKVILISANDLRRLHTIFGECFNNEFRINEPENVRLANGWKEFISKLSGNFSPEQKEEYKDLNSKSIAELTKIAFGIPSVSEFSSMTIKEILALSPARFEDREKINRLKSHIRQKYEQLGQNVLNKGDRYKYSFYIDDVLYYWISADDLP